MSLNHLVDLKKEIVKNLSEVKSKFDRLTTTIPNKTLLGLVTGSKFTASDLEKALEMALQEKGFNIIIPIDSEMGSETGVITYSQKLTHKEVSPAKLMNLVCAEYEITTDMGKLALKQALANLTLFDKKQRDYGSGNISDFGELGVLIRLNDKINRLKNLLQSNGEVNCESVADTWDDIANYGLIGKLCNQNLWK